MGQSRYIVGARGHVSSAFPRPSCLGNAGVKTWRRSWRISRGSQYTGKCERLRQWGDLCPSAGQYRLRDKKKLPCNRGCRQKWHSITNNDCQKLKMIRWSTWSLCSVCQTHRFWIFWWNISWKRWHSKKVIFTWLLLKKIWGVERRIWKGFYAT